MPRILRSAHVYLIARLSRAAVGPLKSRPAAARWPNVPDANYTPGALVLASVGQIGPMITTHRAGKMKIASGKMSFS